MSLSPEEKQRIEEEEKTRIETRQAQEGKTMAIGCGGCLTVIIIIALISFVGSCFSSTPNPAPQTPSAQVNATQPAATPQQNIATMNATVPQFIEIYNKEIKQRYGDKSALSTEKPVRAGTTMYDVPDGKGSHLIVNYNPTDSKITAITFTVQGEQGEKFDRKALRAWTAAVISATTPGVSNDDIIEIRGKILGDSPATKNGIFYMAQYTEKGSPFFQIIARAK